MIFKKSMFAVDSNWKAFTKKYRPAPAITPLKIATHIMERS
jgi:hypothetical protein